MSAYLFLFSLLRVVYRTIRLKGLGHADSAKKKEEKKRKKKKCMNFYCFMYDFYAALISTLVLLKCANLKLTVVF